MKRFIIDELCEMVCHCGMNGMNHDGGIVATVSHLPWVEWLVTSSRSEMVYHSGIRLIV